MAKVGPNTHRCPRCGKVKRASSFGLVKKRGWKRVLADGTIEYRYSYCKACNNARVKEDYADRHEEYLRRRRERYAKNKDNPEVKRRKREEAERYKARRRERYRERMSDPVYRAAYREQQRLYAWERRRRAGKREYPNKRHSRVHQSGDDRMLPIAPLREWLERLYEKHRDWDLVAEICGTSQKRLWTFRNESEHVSLGVADKLLTSEGSTFLWDLWPELAE